METDGQQNLQDDRTNDCWSSDSHYLPRSQTRKISVGLTVDSTDKTRCGATMEDQAAVPKADEATYKNKISQLAKNEGHRITAATTKKQIKAPEPENSPWRSYEKTPAMEALPCVKKNSTLPVSSSMLNKFNEVKEVPETHSVPFSGEHNSILQSSDGKERKSDRTPEKREGRVDGMEERVEEFSFVAVQEVHMLDKGVTKVRTNQTEYRSSEALKMKLWEILGTVSSPNKQFSNPQNLMEGENNFKPEQNSGQKCDVVDKPRQKSDSIETDPESPDLTIKRPVTRSLTRKRAPPKVLPNKSKTGMSTDSKWKHQQKSIFSFEEGSSGRLHFAHNNGSLMSKADKSERKSSRVEPHKICFRGKNIENVIEQEADRSKAQPTAEKALSISNRKEGFLFFPPPNDAENSKPKNGHRQEDSHQSPGMKKANQIGDSPALPKRADHQEELGSPSLKSVRLQEGQLHDFQSPIFVFKPSLKPSSSTSLPKVNQKEWGVAGSELAGKRFTIGDIRSFRTLQTLKSDCNGSTLEAESSDDEGELKDSPAMKSVPTVEERDVRLSKSSSEERDSESSEDGHREFQILFPKFGPTKKSNFMPRPTKRLCSHESSKFNEFGIEESDDLHGPSEEKEEDGLARAVTLFALALERVKSKMKWEAKKKSSEILTSVAEGIHLQLLNIESQIQKDVGKTTSLSKSKRKCLEERFQEQQEAMKCKHEHFKEEVNRHVQDCRSTLEGLEAQQVEFKGIIERQKASHRKLLLKMEEAIEMQLNDAQRRIAAIHKLSRKKMVQLKNVIAQSLQEGTHS